MAVTQFYNWHQQAIKSMDEVDDIQTESNYRYDAFISYCHQDSGFSQVVIDNMNEVDQELSIFIDVQSLKVSFQDSELYRW